MSRQQSRGRTVAFCGTLSLAMIILACAQAQDRNARQLLDTLPEVASRFDPEAIGSAAPGSAGVFASAAIPARYALERGDWAGAVRLEPRPSKYPYTEALTYFARALGAARIGDTTTLRSSIDALQRIHQQLGRTQRRPRVGNRNPQRRLGVRGEGGILPLEQ